MESVLKVLNVSGGDFETEDGKNLKWGNIITLGEKEIDFSKNLVGFPVMKMKFAVSPSEFDSFLSQLKQLCIDSKGILEQNFKLKTISVKGQAVVAVVGFAK